jgi:hypothetical protein
MAQLYKDDKGPAYIDKEWITRPDEYRKALEQSATVYIGNLAFFTTEEQIWELFSKIGEIKRIIMGLDSVKRTPCGFCFVEYVFVTLRNFKIVFSAYLAIFQFFKIIDLLLHR